MVGDNDPKCTNKPFVCADNNPELLKQQIININKFNEMSGMNIRICQCSSKFDTVYSIIKEEKPFYTKYTVNGIIFPE